MKKLFTSASMTLAVLGLLALAPAARAQDGAGNVTGTAKPGHEKGHKADPAQKEHHAAVAKMVHHTHAMLVHAWNLCKKEGQDKEDLREAYVYQHAAWQALKDHKLGLAAHLTLAARGEARKVITANKGKLKAEQAADKPEETQAAADAKPEDAQAAHDASAKDAPAADAILASDPKTWKGHEQAHEKDGGAGEQK